MVRVRSELGMFWGCAQCGGRAVTLPVLRKSIARPFLQQLWAKAREGNGQGRRPCPMCERAMASVRLGEDAPDLDVCGVCHMVWFDPAEFERAPERPADAPLSVRDLSPEARELIAKYQIEQIAKDARRVEREGATLDAWWKYGLALFGVPVEADSQELKRPPVATWLIAALIALATAIAFLGDPSATIENFGLIPSDPWRLGGLTFLTSFFLHAGVFHVLGNLYFLLVFGDNTEDHLGRNWYLALLLLATITGDLLHIAFEPRGDLPIIGASGGISGVILFYALAFPYARLGLFIHLYVYFRWFTMPAILFVLFWIVFQFFGAWLQMAAYSNISALAHLGGAAVGLVFWLIKGR